MLPFIAAALVAAQPPTMPASHDLSELLASLRPTITPISGPLGLADISVAQELPSGVRLVAEIQIAVGTTLTIPLIAGNGTFTARVMQPSSPGESPITFRLVLTDAANQTVSGELQTASCNPGSGHATPDWTKGAVWYQVFVERFRNGNPANDPKPPEFFAAPWNSDWNAVTPDELELARVRAAEAPIPQSLNPRRPGGQLGNVLSARRYGGDLEGLVEKLDELKDLGVTALYLNPIFHAHSHHKYDASDYRHIDPNFAGTGTTDEEQAALARETADPATWILTAADRYFFDVLIPEVRKRNMRIVLDGVWNHVGIHHWAFQDVLTRGVDSPYKDWFQCTFAAEADFPDWRNQVLDCRPGRLIGWKSWGDRNGGLPEFSRDKQTGRLHPEVERHIFEATRRWSTATDGWRLDVVPDVPLPFWRAWSDHVRSINPDAALFAEVWFDGKDYMAPPESSAIGTGKVFDGQMNYPFAFAAVRWLAGEPDMTSAKLATQLTKVFAHAPQHDLTQMNLLGSHDTERLASMLANPGRAYDQEGSPITNRRYNDERPSPEVYQRVVLAAALQALHLGSPMIYGGDEYGMFGADDPHCRKPVPWPDRGPYQDPAAPHEPGLREQFRGWLALRADPILGPTLRYGSIRFVPTTDPDLLVFERRLNNSVVVAALNRSRNRAAETTAFVPTNAMPIGPGAEGGSVSIGPLEARAWIAANK